MAFFENLLALTLDAAPWLLLGLAVAGLIKAWMSNDWLAKQLGDSGFVPVFKAAIIGTPLPLCSCSVIPVAMGIRRSGASKSSTVSFLVATPETGADSIALSYAMLGPVMAVVRPIAAIFSAIASGILVALFDHNKSSTGEAAETTETGCCSKSSCCDSAESSSSQFTPKPTPFSKLREGLDFAFSDIFDDFIKWLAIGLVFAALVQTFVPQSFLLAWGSGLPAMLVMMAVGIPMYICATASTPIAAALILAGISPGTALVFLLAGPATNMATLAVINQELGRRALLLYLLGMGGASILSGLTLDALLNFYGINITSQLSHTEEMLPGWLTWGALMGLAVLTLMSIQRRLHLLTKTH